MDWIEKLVEWGAEKMSSKQICGHSADACADERRLNRGCFNALARYLPLFWNCFC